MSNEMRKLLEAVEQLNEAYTDGAPGPKRVRPAQGRWEKRSPTEVLQYTRNKRTGGPFKEGYRAFVEFDGEQREITRIHVTGNPNNREYYLTQPNDSRDIVTKSLDKVEVYKETLDRIL